VLQELLGTSPALATVREELARLLALPAASARRLPPVLIQGETGTGKGLVAHMIHRKGPRADAPFVDVNCAAIPDTLLEAEVFGFERGAFTDARQSKAGLLQVAHRGTIFLDEIGLMPDSLQAKLLKAIEDRTVRRLGSTRSEPADAWVIAATSEDLGAAIAARRFREDLYHRLAVVTVQLPPLRQREADILLIARHYLDRASIEYRLPPKTLASDAEAALMAYQWPGNVRELANLMERVALLTDPEQVTAAALRLPRTPNVAPVRMRVGESVDVQMATLERARIEEALRAEAWNISRAAARLGLPRNTLRYRIERHGLNEGVDSPTHRRRSDSPGGPSGDNQLTRAAAEAAQSVRWQRTRVTLLQADVFATDALAAHERSRVIEDIARKASAFGGRVLEVSDSSVKVAFGLDLVEDAAQHAAHAGFAIHRALGASTFQRPDVRIALHTEEMRVGRLDERVELDADGRRRAQQTLDGLLAISQGEPIVASAVSKPFLERRFELGPLRAAPEPRDGWRVIGLIDTDRYASPFVSRVREIAVLEDLLSQVEEGRGQAVLLVGDPGIGKTRLLHEFHRRTMDRAAWLSGSAVSFGGSRPFHPLIDLLKHAFSIQAIDSDEVIAHRIDHVTAPLGEEFRASMKFVRSLLSIEDNDAALAQLDPKLRRAGIFEAIARFLRFASEARPVIVVLEDLHWMDQATGEFLGMMVESLASSRILLCATHRTGYTLPFAQGAFGTQLTLSRVSPTDSNAIASALAGGSRLSAELRQLIDDKTEGNPFFVEEILRSLQEHELLEQRGDEVVLVRPIARIDVPDSIHDVLLGRLDRLDGASRDVIRVAAVIGREFPRRVLDQVVPDTPQTLDERLRTLRSADLVRIARAWPDVIYTFKHALTHEVAYDSQSEAERRSQHARIGEAVERLYADRLPEHVGVLAHHFLRAERWDKAVEYLLAAADRAERAFAPREALAFCDDALRAAERVVDGVGEPNTLIRIHETKARLYFVTSDFQRSVAEGERILPLARLTGNRVKEAEALATVAWASIWAPNLDTAIRFAREALAVAEPAGALAVQGRAHYIIGFIRGVTGVLEESQTSADKAMSLSAEAGDPFYQSLSLSVAGLLRNWAGEYGEANRLQSEGLTIAREHSLLSPLLFSCFMRGLTLTGKGDYDEALASFNEGVSLAERIGDEAIHHRLLNCLGWLYADLGDLDHAETLNATSAKIGRRRGDPGTQPNAELNLADIFRARGELARAEEQYDGVYKYWKNPAGSPWMRFRYSIRMFAAMGELAVARGDLGAARSHKAECLELASRTGSRKNLVKGWRLAGEIARAERDWDNAEAHFRTALELAVPLGNPVQHWTSELALGRLLRDAGRTDEAQQAFKRALAVMQHVQKSLRDDGLRAALEKNPDFQLLQNLIAGV
jgi:transcriptional regulator with AAA-type ATPase domain/tetratricopeptide (TPR) repeat protein